MRTLLVTTLALAATLTLAAAPARAQSEDALKEYFEGRTVTVKIDMPGTEDGVDVYPGTNRPLDYSQLASRLKKNGTSLKAGQAILVTKIKVKDKLIEFQLGGGGYGTFGDETSNDVSTGYTAKTKREENLEKQLKNEKDPVKKREMKEELDDLKKDREREDSRNRAAVAAAEEQKAANIRLRRLEGGSRFNLRYKNRVPESVLTPEAFMEALSKYVEFGDKGSAPVTSFRDSSGNDSGLKKGMLVSEVEALLGPSTTANERKEGKLTVSERVYRGKDRSITAEFVEGVMIRYSIASN